MRVIPLALASFLLFSCSTPAPPPQRSANKQAELTQLLAGKAPERTINCLPHYRDYDMRIIDEDTVAFRDGGRRTYVTHMNGGCSGLGSIGATVVTRLYGTADICRGDIARVVDTSSGMTIGSCAWGEFTPYVSTRR